MVYILRVTLWYRVPVILVDIDHAFHRFFSQELEADDTTMMIHAAGGMSRGRSGPFRSTHDLSR